MAERNLSIRLQLKDSESVKKALEDVGQTGGRSLKLVGDAARDVGPQLDAVQRMARQTGVDMGTLGGAAGVSARALEGVRRAADPLHAATARLSANTRTLSAAYEAGQIDATEYALRLQQLQGRFDQLAARQTVAATTSRNFAIANDAAVRSSSQLGGRMQQVGFQIGDAATQISMGGNAVQALAVQGGQLLGAFGPWGAVLGAGVVVVGALGSALFGTKKETDGAKDALETYSGAMSLANELTGDAAKAARELAEAQRQQAIQARKTAVDQAEAAVTAVQSQISQLEAIRGLGRIDAAGPGDTSDTYTQAGVQIEILRKGMADLEATLTKARIGLAEAEQGVGSFGVASDRSAKKTKRQKDENDALVDGVTGYIGTLKETTRLMGLDADEREKVEAVMRAQAIAMKEGNLLGEDQIRIIRDQIEAQQDLRDAETARRLAEREARRDAERSDRDAERLREQAAREAERTTDRVVDYASGSFEEYPAAALADPVIGNTLSEILS